MENRNPRTRRAGAVTSQPREMAELLARVPRAPDPGVLLGLEGQAASLYFANFGRMLKAKAPGAAFDFTSRNRRPPRDPVNALLSFAYALLAKDCFSAACTVGFDPYQGFYHVGQHGRPSLALDLMEEFRAVIADSVVLNLINNGIVVESDFLTWRDACQLTDAGRAGFFKAYEQRKATEVTHPVFGYKMSYGRHAGSPGADAGRLCPRGIAALRRIHRAMNSGECSARFSAGPESPEPAETSDRRSP